MKIHLIYKGMYTGKYYNELIEIDNRDKIKDLADEIEESYISGFSEGPINFYLKGDKDDVCNENYMELFKYKMFATGKINEISQLVGFDSE